MTEPTEHLSFSAPLADYAEQAEALLRAVQRGDDAARWAFKWQHPRYSDLPGSAVDAKSLTLADSRLVVARQYHVEDWSHLSNFVDAVQVDANVQAFERAVEYVVDGELEKLNKALLADADLVTRRSTRMHRATLLHYVAANGVEDGRQRTPANAVAIADALLTSGADPDALAHMYGEDCTTMSMLVSSSHPAQAGVQSALIETLLDHGANLYGPGSKWQDGIITALAFGFVDAARTLQRRSGAVDSAVAAAGLGMNDDLKRLLPVADAENVQAALTLAAMHGNRDAVEVLLDAGADPSAYNPNGFHSHCTPLHQAIWFGHADIVRLLVGRGADLTVMDTIYEGTPLDWAIHAERDEIAAYLREFDAPTT